MKSPLNSNYIVIDSEKVEKEYLVDLFRYCELFYFLALRDLLVRYKEAFFGIAWAIFRPLMNMALLAFIFGSIANFSSEGINYPLFVLSGIVPWQLFSSVTLETSTSLLNSSYLLTKVYFPRMIIPLSQAFVQVIDFFVNLVLLILISLFMGYLSFVNILFFPFILFVSFVLCAGLSLWLSAFTLKYRDVRFVLPFLVQLSMYLSPVGYGSFIIPEKWLWLYSLNPLVGIIDGYRWALFGLSSPFLPISFAYTVVISTLVLFSGFYFFRKLERSFVDIL
jgi:lipopolysaccharide transport system permease protein